MLGLKLNHVSKRSHWRPFYNEWHNLIKRNTALQTKLYVYISWDIVHYCELPTRQCNPIAGLYQSLSPKLAIALDAVNLSNVLGTKDISLIGVVYRYHSNQREKHLKQPHIYIQHSVMQLFLLWLIVYFHFFVSKCDKITYLRHMIPV